MNEQAFKNLISGKTSGTSARLARFGLAILEPFYRVVVSARNAAFDLGFRKPREINRPVISVGNVTTGGTGKTPIVALIVQMLQRQGHNPAIISRGYRSVNGEANDEKQVLERLCPGVPHEQHSSRFVAAQTVLSKADVDTIIMDDGFQHRHLRRQLDVVLIDATNPFGYGHLLPRGLLREPLSSLRRTDVVLITRSNMVETSVVESIEQQIRELVPKLADRICHVEFQAIGFLDGTGHRTALADAVGQVVLLISGIGNPEAFELLCRRSDLEIKGTRWFPDHHHYTSGDLAEIDRECQKLGVERVVTTLKDLVKLPASDTFVALEIAAVMPRSEHLECLQRLVSSVAMHTAKCTT